MRAFKLALLFSGCIHLIVVGILLAGINFPRRRIPASIHNVKIVDGINEIPSVSKSAEASQIKTEETTEKVKVDTSDEKKKEDEKKLEEFLKKRKHLEELMKEREKAESRAEERKQEELEKLDHWSKELGDRRILEELKVDSGVVVFPGWYMNEVYNRIFSSWEPPSGGGRGGAIIAFDISRTGAVNNIIVERSSGNTVFDFSCEEAVRKASPFPVLPELFRGDMVRVHVTFKEE